MKYSIKKSIKLSGLLLFSILSLSFVKENMDKSKTFTKTAAVNSSTDFKVKNNCGPISFKNISADEARIEAILNVEGETEAEINKVINQFELKIIEAGSKVEVVAENHVKNWIQINSLFRKKNTVTFDDNTEAYGITKIDVEIVVFLPEVNVLSISNKYDDVKFESFNHKVEAEIFSGSFVGGNITGDLEMNMKYGDINIGDIENGDFTLFDCDSSVKNAKDLNLNVKYSNVTFEDIINCKMSSFDDEIKMGDIAENIELEAKYSNIEIGNFAQADFDLFDCDSETKNGNEYRLESKYGNHRAGDIDAIFLDFFQDELRVGNINKLDANSTKYSEIDVNKVASSFEVDDSFQDNFKIGSVDASINALKVKGKYIDLDFPIPSSVAYHLDADLQYSSFVFPDSCNNDKNDNGDKNYSINCEVNNPSDQSLQVTLDVFDGDIVIK